MHGAPYAGLSHARVTYAETAIRFVKNRGCGSYHHRERMLTLRVCAYRIERDQRYRN